MSACTIFSIISFNDGGRGVDQQGGMGRGVDGRCWCWYWGDTVGVGVAMAVAVNATDSTILRVAIGVDEERRKMRWE